jgi:hypothetical protein
MMALYGSINVESPIATVVQFPDLTEIVHTSELQHEGRTIENILKVCQTEFAFATTADAYGTQTKSVGTLPYHIGMERLGFSPISAMNNWYPLHSGNYRRMILWWKRLRTGPDVVPIRPSPAHYGPFGDSPGEWHCKYIQFSGCGFKIADSVCSTAHFWRFHTLMRMPLQPNRRQLLWLERYNFKNFAIGSMATFWANGWDAASYSWERVEKPYWEAKGVTLDAYKIIRGKPKSGPESPNKVAGQQLHAGVDVRPE